jgi:putative hemolysin
LTARPDVQTDRPYLRGMFMVIFSFILTLLLMAFFTGIEMAFYSVNRLSIGIKKKQAGSVPQILTRFIESPARFLVMTLIGYTVFLVYLTLQISSVMAPVWRYFNIVGIRLASEIILATVIVLIFAEFIPRAIFRAKSNIMLSRFSYLADFFYQVFYPIGLLLINFSEWILKYVFNVRLDKNKEPINRGDLKHLFRATEDEDRQERNTQLMENAQELPKVKIRQCLVPRKEIIGIDSQAGMDEVKNKFVETKLSKLVVYENNIDHIIGYIHQLDLFKKPASIIEVLLPIFAVPESMSATDLINKFTRERKSIAWVVDEFGGTAGIITMDDVVEKQLSDTEFIFSGRVELDYLEEKYGFEFGEEETETLSGYIINYHETIPRQKERIIIDDYEFDILNVSDTRIEMVKMRKLK